MLNRVDRECMTGAYICFVNRSAQPHERLPTSENFIEAASLYLTSIAVFEHSLEAEPPDYVMDGSLSSQQGQAELGPATGVYSCYLRTVPETYLVV